MRNARISERNFLARWLLVAIAMILFLNGCALYDWVFSSEEEEEEETPAQLMSLGTDYLDRGYYEGAAEAFQKVKDRYPYSQYAVTAELKMGDALFKRELYEEAYETYSEFERLHPKNPNVPYVIYMKGMCHFEQISTTDRDQSSTLQAREEFERLIKRFPNHEYAEKAALKLRKCYIYLADHELYVGHFYFKGKNYRAAIGRYRYILENYPDLGQYQEALEYLKKAKEKLAEQEEKS
jgi:outer membrane protein assembly factor BamD